MDLLTTKDVISFGIAPDLHQGPAPLSVEAVVEAGFSVLVFCAQDIQPPIAAHIGLTVMRCPLVDDRSKPIPEGDFQRAVEVSRQIAIELDRGAATLITCQGGLNRSGLVMALTLMRRYRMTAADAIKRIRICRGENALHNQQFVRRLLSVR